MSPGLVHVPRALVSKFTMYQPVYCVHLNNYLISMRTVMNSMKGHEPKPYKAILVTAGLLFKFTTVKLRGPNKSFKHLELSGITHK